jgi:hypothetical protein
MSTNQKKNRVHAAGRYSAAIPPLVEAIGTGDWGVVRNGAGDTTVTLLVGIDATERLILATSRVTSTQVSVVSLTDTTFQVLCISDAAAATDTAVDFVVLRIAA